MGDLNYAEEKLSSAVHGMSISEEPLRYRLAGAFLGSLVAVTSDDFPDSLAQEFSYIRGEVTKAPDLANEGTIMATTRTMTDLEAKRLIERLVMLHEDSLRELVRQRK